jgi:hypothetical protein
MKFVRPNTGHISFEKMMALRQIASASITQLFKRLCPIFDGSGESDHRKYVDFTFRG